MEQDKKLKMLYSEKDLELLMEFRQAHFDEWTKFCEEKGYWPDVCAEGE